MQNTLFKNDAFVVRDRPSPVTVDSLPKGDELKKAKRVFAEYLAENPGDAFTAATKAPMPITSMQTFD